MAEAYAQVEPHFTYVARQPFGVTRRMSPAQIKAHLDWYRANLAGDGDGG